MKFFQAVLVVLLHLATIALAANHLAVYKATSPTTPISKSLQKRDGGYQPEFGVCDGDSTTCAGACGAGYEECNGNRDDALFCFDPARGQRCCMDGTGTACDPGFYCAGSTGGNTVCCPDTMNINDCAAAFEMQLSSIAMPETTTVRVRSTMTLVITTSPPGAVLPTPDAVSTPAAIIPEPVPEPTSPAPSSSSPASTPSLPPPPADTSVPPPSESTGGLGGVVPDEDSRGADPSTGEDPEDTGATIGDSCSEDSALPLDDSTCSVTCEAGVQIPAPREVAVHVETTITTTITATIPGPSGGCSLTATAIRTLILEAVETLTLGCEPTTDDELRTGVPGNPEEGPSPTASDPGSTPEPPSETALTPEIPSSAQETADVPDVPATDPIPTTPTTVTRSQTLPSTTQTTPAETTTAVISAGASIFHHGCRSYLLAALTMIAATAWNSMA